jgi:MFS family permease
MCGLPFSDAALVLEWHVIGMFAPGFFTGHLIKRFGALPIMGVGMCAVPGLHCSGAVGRGPAPVSDCLFLLGVGWNFVFTGSTTLSLSAYTPEEKDRAQGALNFFVFATLALSSFASGVLVTTRGLDAAQLGLAASGAAHGRRHGVACRCHEAQPESGHHLKGRRYGFA